MLTPEKRAELADEAAQREFDPELDWIAVDADDLLDLLDAADERDRLAAAIKQVWSFATEERDKISRTYDVQPSTAYAGYANAMDDVIRIIETETGRPRLFSLPLHRTEAGYPYCSTCEGGGCPDCTDPA